MHSKKPLNSKQEIFYNCWGDVLSACSTGILSKLLERAQDKYYNQILNEYTWELFRKAFLSLTCENKYINFLYCLPKTSFFFLGSLI